jgi:hypothetical protein
LRHCCLQNCLKMPNLRLQADPPMRSGSLMFHSPRLSVTSPVFKAAVRGQPARGSRCLSG